MIRVIEGLAKLHSKLKIKFAYLFYFIDIIETISSIIFIIMFLIRLHAHAVGRQLVALVLQAIMPCAKGLAM